MINDRDIDLGRIKQAANALHEHFDSVQILATRSEPGGNTVHCNYGAGNFFARYGHVKSFVNDIEKGYILGDAAKMQNNKQEWE